MDNYMARVRCHQNGSPAMESFLQSWTSTGEIQEELIMRNSPDGITDSALLILNKKPNVSSLKKKLAQRDTGPIEVIILSPDETSVYSILSNPRNPCTVSFKQDDHIHRILADEFSSELDSLLMNCSYASA